MTTRKTSASRTKSNTKVTKTAMERKTKSSAPNVMAMTKPVPVSSKVTKTTDSKTKTVADTGLATPNAPIRKPELIDRVVNASGMKKKDVKPVVEALLAELSDALLKGEDLVLPPLGKVMVKNSKDLSNATIVNIKLRHPKPVQSA